MRKSWIFRLGTCLFIAVMLAGFLAPIASASDATETQAAETAATVPAVAYTYKPVNLTSVYQLTFDQDVTPGPGFGGISMKDNLGNPLQITAALNSRTLSVTPKDFKWKPNTHYSLTIPADALINAAGSPLPADLVVDCLTPSFAPDLFTHTGSDYSQPRNPRFRIMSDQKLRKSVNYNNIVFKDRAGNIVKANKTLLPNLMGSNDLWISPAKTLKADTEYTLCIPENAVTGSMINAPNAEYTILFKTSTR
ncbi:MAG: Ig-like domain-containing protein [Solirubrobacterales bacterium]